MKIHAMKKKITAAGGIVTNQHNELLMIYRRGFWDLPKGKLDKGETIEECALREVQEETGVSQLTLAKLIDITYHDYFDKYLQNEVTKETYWYQMKTNGTEKPVPQTEEDIEEIKWVPADEINDYLKKSYSNIQQVVQKFMIEKTK